MCCIAGKASMLPHTGLFLLWKVTLQMRIRRRLKLKNTVSDDLFMFQAIIIRG